MTKRAARIIVKGMVQGVGFRYFCLKRAQQAALVGSVKNRSDGAVEVWVEGDPERIEQLTADLRLGPSAARVENLDIQYGEPTGQYRTFEITH